MTRDLIPVTVIEDFPEKSTIYQCEKCWVGSWAGFYYIIISVAL